MSIPEHQIVRRSSAIDPQEMSRALKAFKNSPKKSWLRWLESSILLTVMTQVFAWFAQAGLRLSNVFTNSFLAASVFQATLLFSQIFVVAYTLTKSLSFFGQFAERLKAKSLLERYKKDHDLKNTLVLFLINPSESELTSAKNNKTIKSFYVLRDDEIIFYNKEANQQIEYFAVSNPKIITQVKAMVQNRAIHAFTALNEEQIHSLTAITDMGPVSPIWQASLARAILLALITVTLAGFFFLKSTLAVLSPGAEVALNTLVLWSNVLPLISTVVIDTREAWAFNQELNQTHKFKPAQEAILTLKLMLGIILLALHCFPAVHLVSFGVATTLAVIGFAYDCVFVPVYNHAISKGQEDMIGSNFSKLLVDMVKSWFQPDEKNDNQPVHKIKPDEANQSHQSSVGSEVTDETTDLASNNPKRVLLLYPPTQKNISPAAPSDSSNEINFPSSKHTI